MNGQDRDLKKILDFSRAVSIVLLALHGYYYCYRVFADWQYRTIMTDHLLEKIMRTGLFDHFHTSKLWSLVFLVISLMGAKGKKEEKLRANKIYSYGAAGIVLFFGSFKVIELPVNKTVVAVTYWLLTGAGYLLMLAAGSLLSRLIRIKMFNADIFNKDNETFPQEERLLNNDYSINLPARYVHRKKIRTSWINIINPFRGLLVLGSPGSGKSYFVIRHVIAQHLDKGFTMFVYDFKFDDLSLITYHHYLQQSKKGKQYSAFYVINFEDLSRSHRCNPFQDNIHDLTDAAESARTILMGLNREWIKKQGDFFVESPINFVTAIIWYLRKYNNGELLTMAHVIELMQVDYDKLFSVLRMEKEIEVLINPFVSAYLNDAMEQLEGQVAAAKIAMARLSSPSLYYILTGSDFTLDINNPDAPKVVCMGNNPQKIQTYGAVLSLFVNRLTRQVNQKNKLPCSLIFDEFPTIYLNNIDALIATARSNKVATTLGIQDFSQLKKDYGRDQADVIMNIAGNIISGQVSGDTAKQLSERFGKIMQDRSSLSINSSDTSVSKSRQLESAIPVSTISALSSGEFVGMVADNPDEIIELKKFHARINNDHTFLSASINSDVRLPVVRQTDQAIIEQNYLQIKKDIESLVNAQIDRMMQYPDLQSYLVKK